MTAMTTPETTEFTIVVGHTRTKHLMEENADTTVCGIAKREDVEEITNAFHRSARDQWRSIPGNERCGRCARLVTFDGDEPSIDITEGAMNYEPMEKITLTAGDVRRMAREDGNIKRDWLLAVADLLDGERVPPERFTS